MSIVLKLLPIYRNGLVDHFCLSDCKGWQVKWTSVGFIFKTSIRACLLIVNHGLNESNRSNLASTDRINCKNVEVVKKKIQKKIFKNIWTNRINNENWEREIRNLTEDISSSSERKFKRKYNKNHLNTDFRKMYFMKMVWKFSIMEYHKNCLMGINVQKTKKNTNKIK